MNFELTDEQLAFQSMVRDFARARLAPDALARAHDPGYPWDVAQEMAQLGLLGLTLPESVGGQGAGLVDAVIAIQAVAEHCPRSADVVQAGNFGAIRTFAELADDELRETYLPGLLAGTHLMSVAMSEPEAGSAVTELSTTAVRDGDDYVVTGSKVFSTNSTEASSFLVYVRYHEGTDGIGAIILDREDAGLTFGSPTAFMNGERWAQLYIEGCRVPASRVLTGPGGFRRQMSSFNVERLGNAARSIAVGRYAFEAAREHARTRTQFGRPLMEFQGIQWSFADMLMTLESAQLLLLRAAVRADRGLPSAQDTALAKLAANEAGFGVADAALQVMGGLGFTEESLLEYCLRKTRGWRIAGGATEILKNRLAEGIFERRFSQRATTTRPEGR